jgi:hypothetical protein
MPCTGPSSTPRLPLPPLSFFSTSRLSFRPLGDLWDIAYLYRPSCSPPRSPATILTPTNHGPSSLRGCSSFGRSTRWKERCVGTSSIDPATLREFEDTIYKDSAGPGPYPTHTLPPTKKPTPPPTVNPFAAPSYMSPLPSYGQRHPLPPKPLLPSKNLSMAYMTPPTDMPSPSFTPSTSPVSLVSPPTPSRIKDYTARIISFVIIMSRPTPLINSASTLPIICRTPSSLRNVSVSHMLTGTRRKVCFVPSVPDFDNTERTRLLQNKPGGLIHIMDDQAR